MILGLEPHDGAFKLIEHLQSAKKNETVQFFAGPGLLATDGSEGIVELRRMATGCKTRRPFVHAHASPSVRYTEEQWEAFWESFEVEFSLELQPFFEYRHEKPGTGGRKAPHRHRVYLRIQHDRTAIGLSHSKRRGEKVARLAEIDAGERVTRGAHDVAVIAALRREGRPVAAGRIEARLRCESGYREPTGPTPQDRMIAERLGCLSADEVARRCYVAYLQAVGGADLGERHEAHGLRLAIGEKAVLVVGPRGSATPLLRSIKKGAGNRSPGDRRLRKSDLDALLGLSDIPALDVVRKEIQSKPVKTPGHLTFPGLDRTPLRPLHIATFQETSARQHKSTEFRTDLPFKTFGKTVHPGGPSLFRLESTKTAHSRLVAVQTAEVLAEDTIVRQRNDSAVPFRLLLSKLKGSRPCDHRNPRGADIPRIEKPIPSSQSTASTVVRLADPATEHKISSKAYNAVAVRPSEGLFPPERRRIEKASMTHSPTRNLPEILDRSADATLSASFVSRPLLNAFREDANDVRNTRNTLTPMQRLPVSARRDGGETLRVRQDRDTEARTIPLDLSPEQREKAVAFMAAIAGGAGDEAEAAIAKAVAEARRTRVDQAKLKTSEDSAEAVVIEAQQPGGLSIEQKRQTTKSSRENLPFIPMREAGGKQAHAWKARYEVMGLQVEAALPTISAPGWKDRFKAELARLPAESGSQLAFVEKIDTDTTRIRLWSGAVLIARPERITMIYGGEDPGSRSTIATMLDHAGARGWPSIDVSGGTFEWQRRVVRMALRRGMTISTEKLHEAVVEERGIIELEEFIRLWMAQQTSDNSEDNRDLLLLIADHESLPRIWVHLDETLQGRIAEVREPTSSSRLPWP